MSFPEYGPGQAPLFQVECGACQRVTEPEPDTATAMCAWLIHIVDEHWRLVETLHQTKGDPEDRHGRLAKVIQELRG